MLHRPIVCIYHGNCADGFTAAWVVRKALGDNVDFHQGFYGEAPPDVTGKHVILVDFSYKRPVLEAMARTAWSLLILDHHKTAEADLAGLGTDLARYTRPLSWCRHMENVAQDECEGNPQPVYVEFDMDRSGAQIAWDFFFDGQPRPKMVDYVGDRDLWRFHLPCSREVAAFTFSHRYDFERWDAIAEQLDTDEGRQSAVYVGGAIERKHHKDIAELVKVTRREMVIGGQRVPVANLPYTMASDAAHALAEAAPFAACYFDRADGQRVFSLRSREDGADVSAIAASYGGGGHKHAAGFQRPIGWEGDL
ncbi:phosphohydrolase [Cereibacter azotoformans]|uniref:phosphohydrolase n=1 Tax=Cereibacter azotoformans TaxID=43057 RepID=UPI001EECBFB7|nr:phosphohydrolase [Cereibacter azotoformans]ULB10706.1 phosphohydrolase [Cereibacter azotoformans]